MGLDYLENRRGFALLYAILVTGAVLMVGVSLMNIITKQIIFSSISKSSESSYYYAASSGANCLYYQDTLPKGVFAKLTGLGENRKVKFSDPAQFSCFGQPANAYTAAPSSVPGKPAVKLYQFKVAQFPPGTGNFSLNMSIYKNEECLLGRPACTGPELIDRKGTVIMVDGYNMKEAGTSNNPRLVKRTVVLVRQ